jgi:hypothetical protein
VIYIEQGQTNQFLLTLSELTNNVSFFYLFAFTNEMDTTSTAQLFYSPDTSSWPERYNLFTLDEPTDITLVKGQYKYEVYISSNPFVYPLSINQTTGVVIEEGRMVVSGPQGTSIYD